MKPHLQAILATLVVFLVVLVFVDWSMLHSPASNFMGVWATEIHAVTAQMMHVQTPGEVLGALLYAPAVVAVPIGYALFIAILVLTVAVRILGIIVRKAASR
jgi:hypothetical protein